MKRVGFSFMIILLLPVILFPGCRNQSGMSGREEKAGEYRVIGYVAGYRDFDFSTIDVSKLTHINYAFANVIDGRIMFDTSAIDDVSLSKEDIQVLRELKKDNPSLRILVSVGGWSWSGAFSDAALTHGSRETFAQSASEFVRKYGLDGIDIDWEYPNQVGAGNIHRPEDRENFTLLLKAVREKLDHLSRYEGRKEKYLLTIATGADHEYLANTDLSEAIRYLDFINIMAYDFHNGLHKLTGHHSNLQLSSSDEKGGSNVLESVQAHIDEGVPASMINLGIPFYGRIWEGVDPAGRGLYREAETTGQIIYYRTIEQDILPDSSFRRFWDISAAAPWLWNETGRTFVSYEDEESIRQKMDWLRRKGLGGVMFWEYSDDPTGKLLDCMWHYLNESELIY